MMRRNSLSALALVVAALAASPGVQAQERSPQGEARKEMRAGNVLSLREIERRIVPAMGDAEYLGPAYDSAAMAYRLKFIRDGRVLFVDVDARTGKVLRQTR